MLRNRRTTPADDVPNSTAAANLAADVLTDTGCESVCVDTPYQTRGTWVVTASCDDDTCDVDGWRVHVDRVTGSTRIVRLGPS